jgi:hypothetical protein
MVDVEGFFFVAKMVVVELWPSRVGIWKSASGGRSSGDG